MFNIFVINPGSTSTKVALYEDLCEKKSVSISHTTAELQQFTRISEQEDFRLKHLLHFFQENAIQKIDAIACRGGLLHPIKGGVYLVNEKMLQDLRNSTYGEHASNLGAILGYRLAQSYGCNAYIADPVVVDELDSIARFSGIPEIPRKSIFHALNHKSVAREVAQGLGKKYEECNFIVAHLGGGISIGAHSQGRVIDVNNALGGDGPFSPERAGGVPVFQLIHYVMEHSSEFEQIKKRLVGKGGITAYCGTNNLTDLLNSIQKGDGFAAEIFQAMAYQISKEIAMHGATLRGVIDRIIITGGMAHSKELTSLISERVGFLAPIVVIPGEREIVALAENILRVLHNKDTVLVYT